MSTLRGLLSDLGLKRPGNMTDFSDVSFIRDPLYSQAARFTRVCEVYAPLYRQLSLSGVTVTGNPALPLQDVREAFKFYLQHLSHRRPFVIMGHSQGAAMLAAMMQTDVDPVPEVRSRMISALITGAASSSSRASAPETGPMRPARTAFLWV